MAKNSWTGRDLISIKDLTKGEMLAVLRAAKDLKKKAPPNLLEGKILASCFFEPSTRTRLSFETAMQRLGGRVIGFADPGVTSAKKGETLRDSAKIIGQYADVLVIRHPLDGAARGAAEATDTPVINAGDGSNQHPTQTLLDLFTIGEEHGNIDGLNVAFVGDLKYGRTVHSLTQALTNFTARLFFVAPDLLQLPGYLLDDLRAKRIKFSIHRKIEEVLKFADVLYVTRIQEERFSDPSEYDKVKNAYRLTPDLVGAGKRSLCVLHPLPRVHEIDPAVDALPQARYFEQAKNGVFVREAVLAIILGKI